MKKNEVLDDSLPYDIEGILFSEEYADTEDNESPISDIVCPEITTVNDNISNHVDASNRKNECNFEKTNIKDVDESRDSFEKVFTSLFIEKQQNSKKKYRETNLLSMDKKPLNDSLRANFQHNSTWTDKTSLNKFTISFIRKNFKTETFLNFIKGVNEESSLFTRPERKTFSIREDHRSEDLYNFTKTYKEIKNTSNDTGDAFSKEKKSTDAIAVIANHKEKIHSTQNANTQKFPIIYKINNQPPIAKKTNLFNNDEIHTEIANKSTRTSKETVKSPTNLKAQKEIEVSTKNFEKIKKTKPSTKYEIFAEAQNKSIEINKQGKNDSVNKETQITSTISEKAKHSVRKKNINGLLYNSTNKSTKKFSTDIEKSKETINTEIQKDTTKKIYEPQKILAKKETQITTNKVLPSTLFFQKKHDDFYPQSIKTRQTIHLSTNISKKNKKPDEIQKGAAFIFSNERPSLTKKEDKTFEEKKKNAMQFYKKNNSFDCMAIKPKYKKEIF